MKLVVYDDLTGARRIDAVDDDGRVISLRPTAEDKKLKPGEYDADELSKGFDPNQPRVPAGSVEGGQWTDGGAGSKPTEAVDEQHRRKGSELVGQKGVDNEIIAALKHRSATTYRSEEIYLVDEDGTVLHWQDDSNSLRGLATGIVPDEKTLSLLQDPKRKITTYHNHPEGMPISEGDISFFAATPGHAVLNVVQPDGSVDRVERGPKAPGLKQALKNEVESKGWWRARDAARVEWSSKKGFYGQERFPKSDDAAHHASTSYTLNALARKGYITYQPAFTKFDPNQPRVPAGSPEGGRWTDGGAGSKPTDRTIQEEHRRDHGEGDATKLLAANHDSRTLEDLWLSLTDEQRAKIIWAENELAMGIPTNAFVEQGGFRNPDGTWTEERQALHAQILENFFNDDAVARATPAPGERPEFMFTGGRPGAGKSTSLNRYVDFNKDKFLTISADDFQTFLPGYEPHLAGLFNQEGQYIAERAERMARQHRLNVIYDATMKSTVPAVERVQAVKAEGYEVSVYFTHTTPQTSAVRTVERFMTNGRYVPMSVSYKSLTNEQTFDRVREYLDDWALFDNNGTAPRLVARKGN